MLITVITVVALVILGFVATFRFAMPLVDPPPPTPDYTVQAVIAAVFMIAILVAAVCAGLYAARRESDRGRILAWTAILLMAGTVIGSILAFTLS